MKKTICYTLIFTFLSAIVTACGKSDDQKQQEAHEKAIAHTFKKSEQKSY